MSKSLETTRFSEIELLLCCARTKVSSGASERIRALVADGINWDYVLESSFRHGVAPLLYHSLNKVCRQAVPQEILNHLRDFLHDHARNNLFMVAELLKLLSSLDRHRVKAIPFKGPVLAAAAYGDLTLRQFGDLDILIHRGDFEKSKALLLSWGYEPWRQLTEAEEVEHLRTEHAYTFVRSDKKLTVDLHWKIAQERYSFTVDPDALWSRLERITLGAKDVPCLSPEDTLLILCIHGSKHYWERLAWICDVAELIRSHHSVDWNRIMEQANRMEIERVLFLGLCLARELLQAPLPKEVSAKLDADPGVKSLAQALVKRLFVTEDGIHEIVERTTLYIRMRERLRDRVPYLLHLFLRMMRPNAKDREFLSLPRSVNFLHYLFRPLRLLRVYGWSSLKRIYNGKKVA